MRETYVAKLGEEKEEGLWTSEFLVSISRVRLMEEILAEICKMTALITTGAKEVSSLLRELENNTKVSPQKLPFYGSVRKESGGRWH